MEREGDDRLPFVALPLQLLNQLGLQIVRIRNHLAGGNLFRSRSLKAKLAHTQALLFTALNAHWWAELAARHRAISVKIAGAGRRIERRTRLVVRKFVERELRSIVFRENASLGISRQLRRQTHDCVAGTGADTIRAIGIDASQFSKSSLQARNIELADGKRTMTTLGASRTADEPGTGLSNCIGKRSIDNLDQFAVARGKRRFGAMGH